MEKNEKVTVNIKDNAKKKVNGFWSQTLHCMIQFEDKRNDRKWKLMWSLQHQWLKKGPSPLQVFVHLSVKEIEEGQGSSRWRNPTKASWWDGRVPKREYVLSEFNGRKNNITVILETKRKRIFCHRSYADWVHNSFGCSWSCSRYIGQQLLMKYWRMRIFTWSDPW